MKRRAPDQQNVPMPSGQGVDEGSSDPEIQQTDLRGVLADMQSAIAELQAQVLGRADEPPDGGTEADESGFELEVVPGAIWTGDCWIAGTLYSGYDTDSALPWIKIDLTSGTPTITEEAGPPPSPWGQGHVWRKKSDQTTIYIDRLG